MAKKKPNIVDILIFVVIGAVVVLAVYKFGVVNRTEATGITQASQEITYTAYIDEVRIATVNALHTGDKLFDEKTGIYIGEIKEVNYEPFTCNVPDGADGVKLVEYPDYYSITLTIEGNIVEKEDGYFVDGVVELKANSEMNVCTKYVKPVMKVTSIDM